MTIQPKTMMLWAMRKVGVPKKRANASAFSPNQPEPKTGARWKCGEWKRMWWSGSALGAVVAAGRVDGLEAMAHLMGTGLHSIADIADGIPQVRKGLIERPLRFPAERLEPAAVAYEQRQVDGTDALGIGLDPGVDLGDRLQPLQRLADRAVLAACQVVGAARLSLLGQQAEGGGAVVHVQEIAAGWAAKAGRAKFGACPGPTRLKARTTTAPWA